MNVEEISEEIKNLEQAETTWQNIQKLAWLKIAYDHFVGDRKISGERIIEKMPDFSGELGDAISGINVDDLMDILTEHFNAIKILYPKEYDAVLKRFSESKK